MKEKNQVTSLPVPSVGGLSIYLAQIKKFPMLDAEEEYMLAKNWRENGNLKAAHKLVTSHLRLVAKIAMGYRGYGLPVNELIWEQHQHKRNFFLIFRNSKIKLLQVKKEI